MKKFVWAASVVFLIAAMAMTVSAQPGGGPGGPGGPGRPGGPGGPGGGMGIEGLLRNEEIRKELNLTEEQTSKLQKIAEENRDFMRQRMGGVQRGPRGQRGEGGDRPAPPSREEMEKMRAEMDKQRDAVEAKVKQILTAEQQEKVATLRFQLSGGLESRNLDARSLETLNLSADQIAKVKAIEEERRNEFRAIMEKRGPVDFRNMSREEREKFGEEMRAQGEAMQKKYSEKISGILTAEQKAKAEKLTAEGKELREKMGMNRGPRGEGGPGGPGGGEYRPGDSSWQPGQGGSGQKSSKPRRAFPQTDSE